MIRGNVTVEENTCKHRYNGICLLYEELCPANVRYNDENENNVPCDLASYIPIRSNKSEK